jgi:hypothetical protein
MVSKTSVAEGSISSTVLALWRALLWQMIDSYRPELHYMRGPGPKWREKHQAQPAGA